MSEALTQFGEAEVTLEPFGTLPQLAQAVAPDIVEVAEERTFKVVVPTPDAFQLITFHSAVVVPLFMTPETYVPDVTWFDNSTVELAVMSFNVGDVVVLLSSNVDLYHRYRDVPAQPPEIS